MSEVIPEYKVANAQLTPEALRLIVFLQIRSIVLATAGWEWLNNVDKALADIRAQLARLEEPPS